MPGESSIVKLYMNKACAEDMEFGLGTVTQLRGGKLVVLHKINLASLPIDEDNNLGSLSSIVEPLVGNMPAIIAVGDNIASVLVNADNIAVINEVAGFKNDITYLTEVFQDNLPYLLTIEDMYLYIKNAREAMNEPTGFNHNYPNNMGIIELAITEQTSAPYTSYKVLKINQNNQFSKSSGQTHWGNGDLIDTTKPYLISLSPVDINNPIKWFMGGAQFSSSTRMECIPLTQSGHRIIYLNATGVLTEAISNIPEVFEKWVPVTSIYGNANTGDKVVFANERHGIVMDGKTHSYLHLTQGTKYITGFGINGLASGSGTYTNVDSGRMFDEDIDIITPIISNTPFWYIDGGVWRGINDGLQLAYITNVRPMYNRYTGTIWVLTEIDNAKFTLVHLFATNDAEYPVVKILGQGMYSTSTSAKEAALGELKSLYLDGLPSLEFIPLYTIILDSSGHLVITDSGDLYVDWRKINITANQGNSDLLPSQAGNTGKFLQTTGVIPQWIDIDTALGLAYEDL